MIRVLQALKLPGRYSEFRPSFAVVLLTVGEGGVIPGGGGLTLVVEAGVGRVSLSISSVDTKRTTYTNDSFS